MPKIVPRVDHPARPRFRGIITTVLLLMMAAMIVRDILVRRWSGGGMAPAANVIRHPW
jgi:hypothetical protein